MQNLKSSLLACKELGDFVKETSLIFEQNTKVSILLFDKRVM